MLAFDFMTLKLAVYFILPAAVVYVLASICAPILAFATQTLTGKSVSQDNSASLMAYSMLPSIGLGTLVYWLTGARWASLTIGIVVFFLVGTFIFGNGIKVFSRSGTKVLAPIGFKTGTLLSVIVTSTMLGFALLVFFLYRLAT